MSSTVNNITPQNDARNFTRLQSFNLVSKSLPKFVERTNAGSKIVFYGANNLYPNYLVELLSSGFHGGIIRSIVKQVKGQGLRIKEPKKSFFQKLNPFPTDNRL